MKDPGKDSPNTRCRARDPCFSRKRFSHRIICAAILCLCLLGGGQALTQEPSNAALGTAAETTPDEISNGQSRSMTSTGPISSQTTPSPSPTYKTNGFTTGNPIQLNVNNPASTTSSSVGPNESSNNPNDGTKIAPSLASGGQKTSGETTVQEENTNSMPNISPAANSTNKMNQVTTKASPTLSLNTTQQHNSTLIKNTTHNTTSVAPTSITSPKPTTKDVPTTLDTKSESNEMTSTVATTQTKAESNPSTGDVDKGTQSTQHGKNNAAEANTQGSTASKPLMMVLIAGGGGVALVALIAAFVIYRRSRSDEDDELDTVYANATAQQTVAFQAPHVASGTTALGTARHSVRKHYATTSDAKNGYGAMPDPHRVDNNQFGSQENGQTRRQHSHPSGLGHKQRSYVIDDATPMQPQSFHQSFSPRNIHSPPYTHRADEGPVTSFMPMSRQGQEYQTQSRLCDVCGFREVPARYAALGSATCIQCADGYSPNRSYSPPQAHEMRRPHPDHSTSPLLAAGSAPQLPRSRMPANRYGSQQNIFLNHREDDDAREIEL